MTRRATTKRRSGFDPKPQIGDGKQIDRVLGPLWKRIGETPRYPVTDQTLLRLVEAGEYRLELDTLELFERRAYVRPRIDKRGRRWSGADCLIALLHLERLRLWRPAPSIHDPKKGTIRLQREAVEREGRLAELQEALRPWDPSDLVLEIATADDPERRIDLYEAWKLRAEMEN